MENIYEIVNINGVNLIFSPLRGIETAAVGVFLKIGSRYETKRLKGIAHFMEHMAFKGSASYSYKKIKQEIEGRGGMLNGFTSQEYTGYYAQFLKKNLEPTLDILVDMVLAPKLLEEEIEKERNVILEEIKMYNDLPQSRVAMLLDKLIWADHPLGEEVSGNFSTVKAIKREDLVNFKDAYYLPSNMVISCSGDFDKEEITNFLREKIKTTSRKLNVKSLPPDNLEGIHIKVENKKLEQAHLCLGFRSISYLDKEKFTAEIINVLLGANMSSRLFEEVREKKALCYDISTDLRKYKDTGSFIVHVGLDTSKTITALKSVRKELIRIKKNDVPYKELERAKDYLLGQVAMAIEKPQGRIFYLAESYLTLNRVYTFDDIKKSISEIDAQRIKKLSQNIFNFNNVCISSIGDFKDKKEEEIKRAIT